LLSYLFARFSKLRTEQLCVIFLDGRRHMIGSQIGRQGDQVSVELHVRPILVSALKANASGCILAHNHPSGDATPSKRDIKVTTRIMRTADALGLRVYDHIVLAGRDYSSFREMGLL